MYPESYSRLIKFIFGVLFKTNLFLLIDPLSELSALSGSKLLLKFTTKFTKKTKGVFNKFLNWIIMPFFKFNSNKIHYITKGRGDLLIILPGNTASSVVHQEQIEYFSKDFYAVSLDFLGTGKSDRFTDIDENWWKCSVEQVDALIVHLGYNKASIIGVSGGAIIAMHFAADFPEKGASLVLDSFSSRFTKEMLIRNIINQRKAPNKAQEQFWSHCHGNDWKEVVQLDTEIITTMVENGGDWLNNCHENIECPVLLIGSRKDEFLPDIEKDYFKLEKQIANCKIAIAEDGGHPLIWTNSVFFYKEVDLFLASI